MNKGGDFIRNPDRRARLLVITQGIWIATLLVLTLWWGTLLKQQSDEIANLETQLGVPHFQVQNRFDKTERMITGESGAFVLLIFITNGILLYLFIRDHRRSKSLQAFFASITHELRTPLTSIKLQAETLKDMASGSQFTLFAERLLEDSGRLESQVQQTLELARLEGGGKLILQSLPVKSFLKNKINSLTEAAGKKVIVKESFSPSCADSVLSADPTAVFMILRNIFDNAIKYTQSIPAELLITCQLSSNQKTFTLTVHHSNAQFSGDERSLGNLFYRGKNSQGAGVGLYLIKALMQKMGGLAKFETKNGFSTHLQFNVEAP